MVVEYVSIYSNVILVKFFLLALLCWNFTHWNWNWKLLSTCTKPTAQRILKYSHADLNKAHELLAYVAWKQLSDTTDVNQALQNVPGTVFHDYYRKLYPKVYYSKM